MMGYKIKDLNKDEKPREKMQNQGPEYLSDVEILSILIGSGNVNKSAIELSREIINRYGSLGNLSRVEVGELQNIKSIGIAKACCIKAGFEIGKRLINPYSKDNYQIKNPKDAYEVVKRFLIGKNKEQLYLLSLNGKSQLIGIDLISIGTINEALVHPREVFKKALERNANSLILVHNHPSNESKPSDEDVKITKRLLKVGIEIGIPIQDHIIATDQGYSSMKALSLLSLV